MATRFLSTKVELGDIYTVQDREMEVVEITYATDALGLAYGWDEEADWFGSISVYLYRYAGLPERAIDQFLNIYVLRDVADHDYYSVGVWHPCYSGWEDISPPQTLPIDHTFTPYWTPGTITIKEDGVAVGAGVGVTVVEVWNTPEDGEVTRLHSAYQSNIDDGKVFRTNASGEVKWHNRAEGQLETPFFIRLREEDTDWNDKAFPATLKEVRLYYKKRHVVLAEGVDAEIDVTVSNSGTLKVQVPEYNFGVSIYFWTQSGGTGIPSGDWDAATSSRVFYNLYEGYYTFRMVHSITGHIPQRESVDGEFMVYVKIGETSTIVMPDFYDDENPQPIYVPQQGSPLWPAGEHAGRVYYDNAHPASGITLWGQEYAAPGDPPGAWYEAAVTGDGYWHCAPPGSGGYVIHDSTWGTHVAGVGFWPDVILGCCFFHRWPYEMGPPGLEEPMVYGFPDLPVPTAQLTGYAENLINSLQYDIGRYDWEGYPDWLEGWTTESAIPNCDTYPGTVTEAMAVYYTEWENEWSWRKSQYTIVMDGIDWRDWISGDGLNFIGDINPYDGMCTPFYFAGRIFGDIAIEDVSNIVGADDNPELDRMGIEHGDIGHRLEQHFLGVTDNEGNAGNYGSYCGNECPYCEWELWKLPSDPDKGAGAIYGRCPTNCWPLFNRDGRPYFKSYPILHTTDGASIRHVLIGPNRKRIDILRKYWYYPADYDPAVPYDTTTHLVLGTWDAGAFADGVDASAIKNNLTKFDVDDVDAVFRPKVKIGAAVNTASYEMDVSYLNGETDTITFELSAGATGILLLNKIAICLADEYPSESMLLITDVTDIRFVEGDDMGNSFRIWADVPSVLYMGVPIVGYDADGGYTDTPYALCWEYLGGTFFYIDDFGNQFRVEGFPDGIDTSVARMEWPWIATYNTLKTGGAKDITIFKFKNTLYYSWKDADGRHLAKSYDDGKSAEEMEEAMIEITWEFSRSLQWAGAEYIIGRDTDGVWKCTARNIVSGVQIPFPDGSMVSTITTGADRAAGFWGRASGWLYVDLPRADGLYRYVSKNLGYVWTQLDDEEEE